MKRTRQIKTPPKEMMLFGGDLKQLPPTGPALFYQDQVMDVELEAGDYVDPPLSLEDSLILS